MGVLWKFYAKTCTLGWWLVGVFDWIIMKTALKKMLNRANVLLTVLETLVVEIEAVLNNRPLTYTPSEFDEMDPLTLTWQENNFPIL